jgi:signal transduction histidine kinase
LRGLINLTREPAAAPGIRAGIARPYLRPQLALYGASATIILLLIVGVVASAWLWQVKDWGIETSDNGTILAVHPGSRAAAAGIVAGDTVPLPDLFTLRTLAGQVATGTPLTIHVTHAGQERTVTLEARTGSLAQQIELSATTWVGMGFVLLGLAPLIARRRTFALWMLFLTDVTTGLFLIAEGPRPFHLFWAEAAAFTTVTIFPAVVFHFHTLFPRRQLGRAHDLIVRAVYALAAVLTLVNLYALTHTELDRDALWTLILRLYLVGCLGASFLMMVASYRAHDRRVREQIRIIALSGGSGLLANVVLLGVATVFSAEVRRALENLGVLAAMATPFGYAFAMLRYNVLIEGLVWRRWLIRAVISSLLFIGGLTLALILAGGTDQTTDTLVVTGLIVVLGALVAGAVQVVASQWLEDHLLRGGSHVDLLDYATRSLTHFRKLEEYGEFFTGFLPARLKSAGGLLFLAEQGGTRLHVVACSPIFQKDPSLAPQKELPTDGDLGRILAAAQGPVRLGHLLLPQALPRPEVDSRFLDHLQELRVELLLPLVSSQQGQLIGLVALAGKETDEGYSNQDLATLGALARTAATAAENVLLFEQQQQQLTTLSDLARRISTAQDEARKRIARDLHDSTLQELGVLNRALTGVREQTEAILARCEDLALEVEMGADEPGTRTISRTALHAMLEELQLKLGMLLGEDTQLRPASPPAGTSFEHQPSIEELIGHVQATARHVREVCDDLHPTYLNDPLTLTLETSLATLRRQYPAMPMTLESQGVEPATMADDVKIAGKEIMTQAIHNAMLHAYPTGIAVALRYAADGAITLTIQDDGVGFVPRPVRDWRADGHHGLANMHERAELIGGVLEIRSAPEHGTLVRLQIPAPASVAEADVTAPTRMRPANGAPP